MQIEYFELNKNSNVLALKAFNVYFKTLWRPLKQFYLSHANYALT